MQVQIECPIDEFELLQSPVQQGLHRRKKAIERRLANGNLQRRETEFTRKRAATRRFDIDHPLGQILIRVIRVRQLQLIEAWQFRGDDLLSGGDACQVVGQTRGNVRSASPGMT